MGNQKTKNIDNITYRAYLEKAQDFYDSVEISFGFEKWNSAGLNAVHAAISITDSMLAKFGGIRSIDSNHLTSAKLLIKHVKDSETTRQATRLRKILDLKNLIEYEGGVFYKSDAEKLKKDIDRYFEWALRVLGQKT